MRTLLVVGMVMIVAVVAADAEGGPLPRGMKVVAKAGRPLVQQGALTVDLRDDGAADYDKIVKAELVDGGKTLAVTAARCQGSAPDDVTRVPFARILARLDHAAGLAAHRKKRHADAIGKLTAAVQRDPEAARYATDLLAVQLAANKLELAGQTLAVHGRRNPVWFAWRIAVDAELAGARDHRRALDLVAAARGSATAARLGERDVATSPLGGGMAALRTSSTAGGVTTSELDVVSLATGRLLARLPLVADDDVCASDGADDADDADAVAAAAAHHATCVAAVKARFSARTATVDALLASLGFTVHANVLVDVRNGDPVRRDGLSIELGDDHVMVERAGEERRLDTEGTPWAIAILPTALVIRTNRRDLLGCADGSSRLAGVALPLR
jgi:hypothetical protein